MDTAAPGEPIADVPGGAIPDEHAGTMLQAAAKLAAGVAAVTGLQADAAGVLEAGAASTAREIRRGSDAVSATAQTLASQAASRALRAAEVVATMIPSADVPALTPEQATLMVAKAAEATIGLRTALEASGAVAMAAGAAELAKSTAESAAAFELTMVATAVKARNLALTPGLTDVAPTPATPEKTRP